MAPLSGLLSQVTPAQWMQGAGTLASAGGKIGEGRAREYAFDYNAQAATESAESKAQDEGEKYDRLMGRQRSLYAKAGVSLSSGSPLLVLADTAMKKQQEIEDTIYAGKEEAAMYKYYGKQSMMGGLMGAGSTFLTGLSKMFSPGGTDGYDYQSDLGRLAYGGDSYSVP